jgi:O-acetyl-ADP-ribose deacetylase (regulator of RNase III)
MKVLIGDIFKSEAKTLVNTVNCVGVMGKGIAQMFKKRYPKMFEDYAIRCRSEQVKPGVPYLYVDMLGTSIINFPTKKHWRSPSRLDDIIRGLDIFVEKYQEWGIQSAAFPPLGCGNGGLEWAVVGPLMYERLSKLDIPIEIYAPYGTPKQQLLTSYLRQSEFNQEITQGHRQKKLTADWVALLEIVNRLQQQPYAPPVGRVIFQKIGYIFTELGGNTGFQFKQGSYGPFSSEVKEALTVFANANLVKETQLGRMTALRIGPEFETVKNRYSDQLRCLDKKINKTVDLFSRIKSTNQAEEMTTVLYAARKLKKDKDDKDDREVSEKDIFDHVIKWKKTWKTKEKKLSVAQTIRNLEMLDWLRAEYSDSLPME